MIECYKYLGDNYNHFLNFTSKLKGRKEHIPPSEIVNDVYLLMYSKNISVKTEDDAKRIVYKYLYNTLSYTIIDVKNKYRVKAPREELNLGRLFIEDSVGQASLDPTSLDYVETKNKMLQEVLQVLDDDKKTLFELLMIRGLKLEDVRDISGVSIGHLSEVKNEFKNLINLIK